jgi:molybdopterin synthase catalytic subunit
MMQVHVKLFAGLRQLAGWSSKSVELPDASTVGALLDHLNQQHPALNLNERTFYAAVNQDFAQREDQLTDGDEVALLPPMSGGASTGPARCSGS